MAEKDIITTLIIDENTTVTIVEICKKYALNESLLEEMVEYGLIDAIENHSKRIHLTSKTLQRIQKAHRLQNDLDINIPGVAIVLDLLEELESAHTELRILKRHVDAV